MQIIFVTFTKLRFELLVALKSTILTTWIWVDSSKNNCEENQNKRHSSFWSFYDEVSRDRRFYIQHCIETIALGGESIPIWSEPLPFALFVNKISSSSTHLKSSGNCTCFFSIFDECLRSIGELTLLTSWQTNSK